MKKLISAVCAACAMLFAVSFAQAATFYSGGQIARVFPGDYIAQIGMLPVRAEMRPDPLA
jgi:hypothetical protein